MLRAFCSNFQDQTIITLDENESKHITSVLRAKENTPIEILNGKGIIAKGYVLIPEKKATQVKITEIINIPSTLPSITLLHASLSNNNTDFVIKEATAIGVSSIWIFQSEHSESKIKNKMISKMDHWNKLAKEACKQSRNPFLPQVYCVPSIKDISLPANERTLRLFGDMDSNAKPLLKCLQETDNIGNITIAIGPEGDFSESEKVYLRENGFIGFNLGKTILRAETAAICSLSVITNHINSLC